MKGRGHSFFLLRVRQKWGWHGQKVSWAAVDWSMFSVALSACRVWVEGGAAGLGSCSSGWWPQCVNEACPRHS